MAKQTDDVASQTEPAARRPLGRPSVFSQDIADQICERLAGGESLRAICRDEGMPSEMSVRRWARDDVHGFASQYATARDLGAECLADEILEIADDASSDFTAGENGPAVDHEHIARSRLRVDTRKWLLSKVLPKRYGDRLDVAHTGAVSFLLQVPVEAKSTDAWVAGVAGEGEI